MVQRRKHRITKNIATTRVAHFQRQELKYFIDNHIVDNLIPDLENFMQRDRFSINGPYEIHSVYYDTYDWQAFYSKMDGNERRQKFRIRSYIADPKSDQNVFVEVKEKNGNTVNKRRTPVFYADVKHLVRGEVIEKESPVVDEWRYAVLRNALKPKLLNSYTRMAYSSEHFPGLRVTIDQDLRYAMTDRLEFNIPTHVAFWANQKSVVEIKFDRYVPQFVLDLVRRYNLTQTPVSKYCDSVISHYLLS